jgi:hypothetical protein
MPEKFKFNYEPFPSVVSINKKCMANFPLSYGLATSRASIRCFAMNQETAQASEVSTAKIDDIISWEMVETYAAQIPVMPVSVIHWQFRHSCLIH